MIDTKEFAMRMQAIANKSESMMYYTEERHMDMDDLMCEVLTSLGYGEGVEIFKATDKWYA